MSDELKHDDGKPRFSLLPIRAVESIIYVLEFGARKYSVDGWRKIDDTTRFLDAAQRHLMAHAQGRRFDKESSLLHLAHAATNLLFAIEKELSR
jgi:hypothetical protein